MDQRPAVAGLTYALELALLLSMATAGALMVDKALGTGRAAPADFVAGARR